MELKNPFAVRKTDGRIVTIADLSHEQRGKACGCICPACKSDLIARMGEIRIPHFAHSGKVCDFVKVFINSLYQLMWEGLQENPQFSWPDYFGYCNISIERERISKNQCNGCERIIEAGSFEAESAEIRKNKQGVAEALIITAKKDHLLAVVLVPPAVICKVPCRNPVEGISTIAIQLPQQLNAYYKTSDQLKRILLREAQYKKWLSSPKIDKWQQQCVKKRELWLEHQQKRIAQEKEKGFSNYQKEILQKQLAQVKEINPQNEEADKQMAGILREYRASQPAIWDYNKDEALSAIRFWLSREYPTIPNDSLIKDPYGERWCFCTTCNRWYQSADMICYGGNNLNLGLCRNCAR